MEVEHAESPGGDPMLDTSRPHGQLIAQYFNTAAFTRNAVGTFGDSGKNILRGPHFFNVDFGVTKRTEIRETVGMEFRAE